MTVFNEYYLLTESFFNSYEYPFKSKALGFYNQVKGKEVSTLSQKQVQWLDKMYTDAERYYGVNEFGCSIFDTF